MLTLNKGCIIKDLNSRNKLLTFGVKKILNIKEHKLNRNKKKNSKERNLFLQNLVKRAIYINKSKYIDTATNELGEEKEGFIFLLNKNKPYALLFNEYELWVADIVDADEQWRINQSKNLLEYDVDGWLKSEFKKTSHYKGFKDSRESIKYSVYDNKTEKGYSILNVYIIIKTPNYEGENLTDIEIQKQTFLIKRFKRTN